MFTPTGINTINSLMSFYVRFCSQMNNEKLVFCSPLDFGIEIKGLWTSMDKTCMMTRKIARKNIVNQANFKVMGPKNCYIEDTFFFI